MSIFANQQEAPQVIIDSSMTKQEALKNLNPNCPKHIIDHLELVDIHYYCFDKKLHKGQMLIHKDLVDDIKIVFQAIVDEKFPIQSAIPLASDDFNWDDEASMSLNNSSAFNYRYILNTNQVSSHSFGCAVDINPMMNPYIKGSLMQPKNGSYDPKTLGTITEDSFLVKLFLSLGWIWGGHWENRKDYQHFAKKIPGDS